MTHWQLTLFGSPQLIQADRPIAIGRRKGLALLAYLAMSNGAHHRDALATLLWPDAPQQRARHNLRQVLSDLNKTLAEGGLLVDGEQISLIQADDLHLDVARFQSCLVQSRTHNHPPEEVCPACLPLLRQAIELYRADFMEGFTLRDAPEFDDWQFFQAESLRQDLAVTLERLVQGYANQQDYEAALPCARRRLGLDPLHEPAYRTLMQLYAAADQQAAALRQYEECVRLLDEEFGLPPEMETTTLYEAIKAKRFMAPLLATMSPSPPSAKTKRGTVRTVIAPPDGNLPHHPTSPPPDFLTEASPDSPLPGFVARERELAQLEAALDSARTGQGQILFVIGGAGRGKTMLIQEFIRRVQAKDADLIVVNGYCDAMTGVGDPYLPFREILTTLTGEIEAKWAGGLISRTQAQRLWELMPLTLPALVQHAPDLIGNFIPAEGVQRRAATLNAPQADWFKQLTTQAIAKPDGGLEQQRIFSQYAALLKAVAAQRPLLLIIEDLHWIDTASSGLIFHLSRAITDSPILILGTYRPEEVPLHWSDDQHPLGSVVSELKRRHGDIWLDLDDLAAVEGRQFIDAYLDTQPNRLDDTFREALFRHTGGYALFTVELLRDMQERGDLVQADDGTWLAAETIDWQTLPAKVEGVIETRIKRLEKAWQEALSIASVEGEIFTAEVVAPVQGLDERELVQRLSRELDKGHRLITAQSMERIGQQRLSRYRFRHNLFQHYLYYNLDESDRSYLHEAVGNVLEQLYAGQTERVAVQLAWHFQEAGLVDKAIPYLQQAGDVAARVYAHTEAIAAYRQALALINQHQPDAVEDEELTRLYSRLGRSLELNSQFDEALAVYQEMEQLARQQGRPVVALAALLPQVTLYITPTPLHNSSKGLALGEKTVTLAREVGDRAAEAKTLWHLSLGGMWGGRTEEGIAYGERAVALARELNLTELLAYALNDLGMLYLTRLRLEQAKQTLAEAGDLWRKLDNLPMLTDSMSMASGAHVLAGEYEQALALSDEGARMSNASNNLWGQSFSRMFPCWAAWELGQVERALRMADESIELGQLAGFVASQVLAGGYRAAMVGKLGALEQGVALARQAVNVAETQFPHFRCHALGVLAQLHLLLGNLSEAETVIEQGRQDPYGAAHPAWNMQLQLAEAELALQQGNPSHTLAVTNHWLPRFRENNMLTYILPFLCVKGQALQALDQPDAARQNLREARDLAEAIGAQAMLWPILLLLSQLESDPDEARRLRRQARDIVEAMANTIGADDLRTSFLNLPQVRDLF